MNQEIKADAGKLRLSLVPTQIIRDIAEVREYGVEKYGTEESWRDVEKKRYIDAMYRHMLEYVDDTKAVDEESGIKHLKMLACNVAFLCEMEEQEMRERQRFVDRVNQLAETVTWLGGEE